MEAEQWVRPTIREVADKAHVSISTVSRVLNQREDLVTSQTRQRVREAVDLLGYSPSRAARNLRTRSSNVIGAVVPDLANPYYALLMRGAQEAAQEAGAALLVCGSSLSEEAETEALNLLYDEGVQGVVLLSSNETSEEAVQRFLQARIPVVAVHRRIQGVPMVTADTSEAAYLLGMHLLEEGYRRLAILAGPRRLSTFLEIRRGVEQAISKEASASLDIWHGEFSYNFGYSGAAKMLRSGGVDAVVAHDDLMAMGALHAAIDLGVSVPDDLGIAGIGQLPWAKQMRPRLTTVYLPFIEMGREAVKEILHTQAGCQASPRSVLLQPRLVIGNTTRHLTSN